MASLDIEMKRPFESEDAVLEICLDESYRKTKETSTPLSKDLRTLSFAKKKKRKWHIRSKTSLIKP